MADPRRQIDAVFMVGDLSYTDGTEAQWADFVSQHLGTDIPAGLLVGNHEQNDTDGLHDGFIGRFIDEMAEQQPPGARHARGQPAHRGLRAGVLRRPAGGRPRRPT